MKTRPPLRQTHTYCTMEISRAAYNEIRSKFVELGPEYIHHYIDNYEKEDEAVVMGTIGLIAKG